MGSELRQRSGKSCGLNATSMLTMQNTDENGHGSHVSGTIGGITYGVAKSVSLVAVKVLDASGAGTNSGTIAGLNFGNLPIPR